MLSECRRHRLPSQYDPASGPYYVKRCAHFGERFVVEIKRGDGIIGGVVDYVEDVSDGEVIVEGHAAVSYETGQDREGIWEWLVERMMADDPPDPEKGT